MTDSKGILTLEVTGLADLMFQDAVREAGVPAIVASSWNTKVRDAVPALHDWDIRSLALRESSGGQVIYATRQDKGGTQMLWLQLTDGRVSIEIAAASVDIGRAILEAIRAKLPVTENDDRGYIYMTFWSKGNSGPRAVNRRLAVPDWVDIEDNYSAGVKAEVEQLVNGSFRPAHGGQLLLFHGPPGTGKTYALRAILSGWREWCGGEYVVDPEVFLGAGAAYLIDVLIGGSQSHFDTPDDEKWRLIILEDAGELVSVDARERAGQALSRLLNVVDGLVGQGLKILVLITTNEELEKLHPAVARPGRCAAQIHFTPLTSVEAARWRQDHLVEAPEASGARTLAELYAEVENYQKAKPLRSQVGFLAVR